MTARRIVSIIACVLGLCPALLTTVANAQAIKSAVSIESMREIATNRDSVDLEITASYDGSLGPLLFGTEAKSADGLIRSRGTLPSRMPVGQHVIVAVRVAPPAFTKPTTTLLAFGFYKDGTPLLFSHLAAWRHDWDSFRDNGAETKPWYGLAMNLQEEDFQALDTFIDQWSAPGMVDENGESPLHHMILAMAYYTQFHTWAPCLERIRDWQKASPQSPGAAVAEALYWVRYALDARGGARGTNDDPYALELARTRMQRAEKALQDAQAYATGTPLWFEAYVYLINADRRPDKAAEDIFAAGITRYPGYLPLYATLMSRWLAKPGQEVNPPKLTAVADQAVANATEADRPTAYARLFTLLSHEQTRRVPVSAYGVPWDRLKASMDTLVARYHTSDNINTYAVFACQAGDKAAFLALLPQIGQRPTASLWPDNYSFDLCRRRFTQPI